jgi:hypothetical protein
MDYRRKIAFSGGLFLAAVPALAQITAGNITGTVFDPTGAIIPGVKITAIHLETARERTALSDESGAYSLRALPIGQYKVIAESPGFKKEEVSGIILQIDQTARVDFRLTTGQLTETVQVEATAPLLSASSSDVGAVVDNKRIVELPMNRREFLQLAELEPGVVPPPPETFLERNQGEFTTMAAMGSRQEYQSVSINGVNNMDPQNNNLAVRPSVDAIQEFKIQTSNYSAELASKGGVVINLAIRSGTNQLHGGLYHFFRNEHLDAKNFFDIAPKIPPYKQNQFGATFGGPVRKDKTFYFLAYEGLRIRRSQTAVTNAATIEQHRGVFDRNLRGIIYDPFTYDQETQIRQPFPNNVIPTARIHPISQKILAFVPLPNNLADPRRNLVSNPLEEDTINQYNGRFDHSFNASNTVFVSHNVTDRYHLVPAVGSVAGGAAAGGQSQVGGARFNDRSQHFSSSYMHLFSPRIINELLVGMVRYQHNEIGRNQGTTFEQQFGIPGTETKQALATWPTFSITGYSIPSEGRSIRYWNTVYQIQDSLNIQRGGHSIKVGTQVQRINNFNSNCTCVGNYSFSGGYTSAMRGEANGDAFALFLLGYPSGMSRGVETERSYIYGHQFGFYAQDDWRLTPKLTLNLGLRYDYTLAYKEKNDRFSSFDPVTGEGIFPENAPLSFIDQSTGQRIPFSPPFPIRRTRNRGLVEPDKVNFGPRFGFAYHFQGKTVVRGAYGMFNIMTPSRHALLQNLNAPFSFTLTRVISADVPNFNFSDGFLNANRNSAISFWRAGELTGRKNGYMQNWNLGIQRALRQDLMVEASYVAAVGRHIDQLRNLNVPQPGPGTIQDRRPFPLVGVINDFVQAGTSAYHSLQMKLVKRFVNGLAANVAYTYGKSIDTQSTDTGTGGDIAGTENPFELHRSMRGPSAFDIRHRLVFNYVWEIPIGPGKRFLSTSAAGHVLGGWQLTGILSSQSGYPFTVSANSTTNNGTGARPNRLCAGALEDPTLNRWFNTDCFASPAPFTYGNSGRNILQADRSTNFDSGLYRNFRFPWIGDSGRLQFRAEFYNLLNHPNFGLPGRNINTVQRAVVVRALPPRLIQFGMKLNF